MLELIYTSNKTVTVDDINNARMYYLRTWDAMILNFSFKAYKLFRDGSQVLIIPATGYVDLMGRVNGRHCWFYTYGPGDRSIWAADEISGNYHSHIKLNENWVTPPDEAVHGGNYLDDISHIAIYHLLDTLHFIDLSTGSEIGTLDLGIYPPDSINQIAWAGECKVVAISNSTGDVFFIDYVNRVILSQSKVPPCKAAAYDCIHNLIITLGSDKLIRVYTMDVVPAVLSNPVFVPTAAHQHRLVGSKVKTRLTGDAGEPCGDYWIHWSLLGSPAKGELLKDKSKTDAEGWAENYWSGPQAVGETGEETLQVSVKVPS